MHPSSFFFFNDTATTEIYTLSLHDALPISRRRADRHGVRERHHVLRHAREGRHPVRLPRGGLRRSRQPVRRVERSEEHTSELQSQSNLVCRLLLEKKNNYVADLVHLFHQLL